MDNLLQFLFKHIRSASIAVWAVWIIPRRSLVSLCRHVRRERGQIGHGVVKLSDVIAVKYGPLVHVSQATAQDYACRRVDSYIVKVPRVYRYFQD